MSISSRRFSLLSLFAIVAVSAACSDATAPGASFSPDAPHFAITIDLDAGTGFVGKGDVQTFFGWNNPNMQANADFIEFRINAVTEWTCTKIVELGNGGTNEIVQERNNSITAVSTVVGRENSQGTNGPWSGFILDIGNTTVVGSETGSCPANPSGFVYDENATTGAGGLQIRKTTAGTSPTGKTQNTWYDFPGL